MRFDDWQLIFRDTSDSTTVNPDNIEVTALNDDGLDPASIARFRSDLFRMREHILALMDHFRRLQP